MCYFRNRKSKGVISAGLVGHQETSFLLSFSSAVLGLVPHDGSIAAAAPRVSESHSV